MCLWGLSVWCVGLWGRESVGAGCVAVSRGVERAREQGGGEREMEREVE